MGDAVRKASSLFREGLACSESVLMGFADANGISSEVIPRIATGFAGGIGRRGSVCGALTGAIMALGLKYGRSKIGDSNAFDLCVAKSSECYKMFEQEFGSAFCYDLIKCDLSTPEGKRIFRESGLRENNCTRYVEGATRILSGLTRGSRC